MNFCCDHGLICSIHVGLPTNQYLCWSAVRQQAVLRSFVCSWNLFVSDFSTGKQTHIFCLRAGRIMESKGFPCAFQISHPGFTAGSTACQNFNFSDQNSSVESKSTFLTQSLQPFGQFESWSFAMCTLGTHFRDQVSTLLSKPTEWTICHWSTWPARFFETKLRNYHKAEDNESDADTVLTKRNKRRDKRCTYIIKRRSTRRTTKRRHEVFVVCETNEGQVVPRESFGHRERFFWTVVLLNLIKVARVHITGQLWHHRRDGCNKARKMWPLFFSSVKTISVFSLHFCFCSKKC